MKIHELVERCAEAAEGRDPMNAVRKVLEDLRGDLADIDRSLAFISGVGGNARQVFFRSPKLFMLKARFPAGRRTPPHNHGTWATIMLLTGREKNTLYLRDRKAKGGLRRAGEKTLGPGDILTMRPDTMHVVECLGEEDTTGLHVYGGDILTLERSMWHPKTLREQPLDFAKYDALARIASKQAAAPDPARA
jgi:predicted metal-dependent enzyme (double-stranded beta helix superfamily)